MSRQFDDEYDDRPRRPRRRARPDPVPAIAAWTIALGVVVALAAVAAITARRVLREADAPVVAREAPPAAAPAAPRGEPAPAPAVRFEMVPAPEAAPVETRPGDRATRPTARAAPRAAPAPTPKPPPKVGLEVDDRAIDLDGRDQDGQRLRLSDYLGRVVVLVFWAEW